MNARKLLKKYCLDIDDMPNPHSINPATIVGVDQEEYETKDDNGKPVKGLRSNLWFREFDLPLRLNNVRGAAVRDAGRRNRRLEGSPDRPACRIDRSLRQAQEDPDDPHHGARPFDCRRKASACTGISAG